VSRKELEKENALFSRDFPGFGPGFSFLAAAMGIFRVVWMG
jgi:hypothetical protein